MIDSDEESLSSAASTVVMDPGALNDESRRLRAAESSPSHDDDEELSDISDVSSDVPGGVPSYPQPTSDIPLSDLSSVPDYFNAHSPSSDADRGRRGRGQGEEMSDVGEDEDEDLGEEQDEEQEEVQHEDQEMDDPDNVDHGTAHDSDEADAEADAEANAEADAEADDSNHTDISDHKEPDPSQDYPEPVETNGKALNDEDETTAATEMDAQASTSDSDDEHKAKKSRRSPSPDSQSNADSPSDSPVHDPKFDPEAYINRSKDAMDALCSIEIKYAQLKDRLFYEQMADLERERLCIEAGAHPEVIRLSNVAFDKRARSISKAHQAFHFMRLSSAVDLRTSEEEVWSSWIAAKNDIHSHDLFEACYTQLALDREHHRDSFAPILPQFEAVVARRRRKHFLSGSTSALAPNERAADLRLIGIPDDELDLLPQLTPDDVDPIPGIRDPSRDFREPSFDFRDFRDPYIERDPRLDRDRDFRDNGKPYAIHDFAKRPPPYIPPPPPRPSHPAHLHDSALVDKFDPRFDPDPRYSQSYPDRPKTSDMPYAEPRYPNVRYAEPPRYPDMRYPDPRYSDAGKRPDPRYPDSRYPDPRYPDARYPRYPEPRFVDPRYSVPDSYADSKHLDRERYDAPRPPPYDPRYIDRYAYAKPSAPHFVREDVLLE